MDTPLWTPDGARVRSTQLWSFMQLLNHQHGTEFQHYSDLWHWSNANSETFWSNFWDFAGIEAERKGDRVLLNPDRMPGARWFPDARLNFARNLLRYRDERPAIVFNGEEGRRTEISFAELYTRVAYLSAALKAQGIGPGDVVAGYMPNIPETVIAMLATTALGGIWTSCSPDFGINGVIDRFGQVKPRVLFTTDGYRYNGKSLDSLSKVRSILESIDSVEQTVVVPFLNDQPDLAGLPSAALLETFWHRDSTEIEFASLPFDHPLYIMYSSGTTGVPKCIVHSAGGTLIQHLKELMLHTDIGCEDRFFYYTTCGWMMWNWMVSGLATGCTLVLFDGSPFAPRPDVLWDMAEREKVTVFGTSAKYLAALEKAGIKPRQSHDLSPLKAVLSTGSPLSHESFDYVYRDIKADLQLSSISGGTDILSCFALGCPILPVWRGELQCPGLGMAVDIFDDDGHSVRETKGELVCTQPFPSMPIGFWNDPEGERYRDAYFASFDNVWAHGDYGEITAHEGVIIHGRSDAVLNPGGVRIGTAEIYRQVEKVDAVLESLCIGQPWQDDVRVVLFVRLREGVLLDDDLRQTIRTTIRANTTPRHVPAVSVQVADIPRTLSGKIVELAVRKTVLGETVKNQDALANPEALALYRNLPELQV
ncbi:acetoacetate--CoA ligase [Marinobacterium sp. AK62]|uniref:Acetoacetate--CoA ligase n=1 Tax=Marinobacterium alkalitolerans TaxID=1542925 RepID=A0ABS3Z7A8_9GAMM|nr:acetoacetate--CoA ligase [Marinobacterium alkalitolerans]MBP0047584.1 acetoacetate--CoA ligase [Marinobacterium alkalitolerans]